MKDYFRETEFVLDKLQFDYLGRRYRGRGLMTWNPEQGFHIEAPLDLQDISQPRDVEFGRVGVIRKSDRSSIRMFPSKSYNLDKSYNWAITPPIEFFNRYDVVREKRISINLSRVIFSKYYSRDLTGESLIGSALYEAININLLPDWMNYEEKVEIQNHEVLKKSDAMRKGIYYEGEKGQVIYGYTVENKYLEFTWRLPKKHFKKGYSWRLAEAIQYSLSILLGQELSLLRRTACSGNRELIEIRKKQSINSLNPCLLIGSHSALNKEYFIKITDLIANDGPKGNVCRNIFHQLIEASRQRNWQVRELLVATVLEAALRNIYEETFKPNVSWNVGNNLGKFIKKYFSKEWNGISERVKEACKYLRNRNAHPDWLFKQGGALSEEEQAKALDSMIFLSRFYGYMILALAGFKDLKPNFPPPHSEWNPVLVIAPTNLNRKTLTSDMHQTQESNNPWQSLIDSLDRFSEDFMETREQPPLQVRENLFE